MQINKYFMKMALLLDLVDEHFSLVNQPIMFD
jgi:hypothetical protein